MSPLAGKQEGVFSPKWHQSWSVEQLRTELSLGMERTQFSHDKLTGLEAYEIKGIIFF